MIPLLWLALGALLLYIGAEALVRGAVALAVRAGMTPLVIGLTVVAAGTSAPELVVSVAGAVRNDGAIAIGNVIGSNICNILLITSITALIRPIVVQRSIVRREIPLMIVVSLLATAFLLVGNRLARPEAAALLGLLVLSIGWSIGRARAERPEAESLPVPTRSGTGPVTASVLLIAGLGLLVIGADRFVNGAVELARLLGVSETVVALTVVAVGTSLPELATSIVAAFKGESDLALGNVVGSNIFNLLGILGVAGLVHPLPLPAGAFLDLIVMIAAAVLILPLAWSGFTLQRLEAGLLLLLYGGYLTWLLGRGI
jgi:cation:H+ antiporter